MKYKGYELLKAIADGEIKDGTKFKCLNEKPMEYYPDSNIYRYEHSNFLGRFGGFNILSIVNKDFEIVQKQDEIDIDSIEHKELEILQEILGQCDLFKGNEKYILKVINENNSRLVDAVLKVSKENEILLQAVKQLNKEVKELKIRK